MEITKEIRDDIRESVAETCKAAAPVVKFVSGHALTDRVCELAWNGHLVGLYYNESGKIIARDVWGEEHEAKRAAL